MPADAPPHAQGVLQRHRQLSQALRDLMASGRHELLDRVLSRQGELAIREHMRRGEWEQAGELVEAAWSRLQTQGQAQAGHPPGSEMRPAPPAPPQPVASAMPQPAPSAQPQPVSQPLRRQSLNDLRAGPGLEPIVKLVNPAIDPQRRRLYITGTLSTRLGVVDLERGRLERTVDIGVTGGFLLVDPRDGGLYLFDFARQGFFQLDPWRGGNRPLAALPSHLSLPPKDVWTPFAGRLFRGFGFPFKPGTQQDFNAAYNEIHIADPGGGRLGRLLHGPDAIYFAIDQSSGRLYASNTGDTSLSVFDLLRQDRRMEDIPLGVTVEGLAWDPQARVLYARSRLGGSQIFRWRVDQDQWSVIDNENRAGSGGIGLWPTGMALYEGRLHVLSHYGGQVDVIEPEHDFPVACLDLELGQKPRTDAISELALDRQRGLLFAAFPELGLVKALDLSGERGPGAMRIGLGDQLSGPCHLVLGVSEARGKLLVYAPALRRLELRQGTGLALEQSRELEAGQREGLSLLVDDHRGLVYLGSRILDLGSLADRGRLEPGQRVVAVAPGGETLYLASSRRLSPTQTQEELVEYRQGRPGKRWVFSPGVRLPLSYAFDFPGGRFFVGYGESGVVEEHGL